jgi:hypothetical protein
VLKRLKLKRSFCQHKVGFFETFEEASAYLALRRPASAEVGAHRPRPESRCEGESKKYGQQVGAAGWGPPDD